MSINPFEILKNAQNIQQQFGKVQEQLKDITATGASGGGIVKVRVNGQMELIAVELDPIAVDPRDISMLQDLIIAAHRDAMEKIRSELTAKLGPLVGGIPGMSS